MTNNDRPEHHLTGKPALEWIAERGGRFCKVLPKEKRPFEQNWQEHPYTLEEILPHIKQHGNVGLLCGAPSGNIGLLDVDQDFAEFTAFFQNFKLAPAIIRKGADKGKILIKINGNMPPAKKWKRAGDLSPFLEWLSDGNQGVIPPSIHPTGVPYVLVNGDQPIIELAPESLDDICAIWAGSGVLVDEIPAPNSLPSFENSPSSGDGLKEAVQAYWDPYKVFQHFGRVGKTRLESKGEWLRLFGNGGLFIHVSDGKYDGWAMPGETGTGGGIFQAWQYCKTGSCQVPKGRAFEELLCEMASEAGIQIPEADQSMDTSAQQRSGKGKTNVPDDDALAMRWLDRHPYTLWGLGDWRRYEDGVWPVVREDSVSQEIIQILREAKEEGIRITRNRVASILELARIRVSTNNEVWDSDPDIIVCKNGALHIPTMDLRPHSPEHHATFQVDYDYAPEASAEVWKYVLYSTIPDAQDFLQEFVGYCLTTDTRHELAVWLCGPSGSGKSTILEGIQAMFGEKATTLGLADIEHSRFSLGNLPGKSLAVASEQPSLYMRASHILNNIISGEKIRIERKFKDSYEITPHVKLLWGMNEEPRVQNAGDGLFRRVQVVRFPPLELEERDPRIKKEVKKEGPGILNCALAGLIRLRERGRFEIPDCVKNATSEFQQNNDVAAVFVKECCIVDKKLSIQAQLLYNAYREWCERTGHKPMSSTSLANEWLRLGFTKSSSNGRNIWHGLGLIAAEQ